MLSNLKLCTVIPSGLFFGLFVGIGWGKSIPFNAYAIKAPLRKLKIASFYAMEIVSRIILAVFVKILLVNFLPLPLEVIREITLRGFQSHGDLIAQGYSSWSVLLGMFGVRLISFNIAMATFRFILGGFKLVFNYIARLVGIDISQVQELLFLVILICLFIFNNEISYIINIVYRVALYHLFGS